MPLVGRESCALHGHDLDVVFHPLISISASFKKRGAARTRNASHGVTFGGRSSVAAPLSAFKRRRQGMITWNLEGEGEQERLRA